MAIVTITGSDVSGGSPSGGGVGGASNLTTAGAVPYVASAGVLTQAAAEFFWDAANNRLGLGTNTPTLGRIHVLNSTTDSGIFINQTGEYRALNILANGPATSLGQAVVDSQTATTGGVLWVGASGAGFTNTTTGASYHVITNAAATGNVVMIRNAGTGAALNIKNDQNSRMVYLDSNNSTTDVVTGAFPSLTTGSIFTVGTGSSTYSNSNGLIRANVAHVSSTGNAFVADMTGGGTAFRANTSKGYGLDVQTSSSTSAGARVFTTAQNNNHALELSAYFAPTGSGKALAVYGGSTAGSLNAWINSVGDAYFGGTASSTYKLDIAASGSSGTLRVWDQALTVGTTSLVVRAGAGQSGNLTTWQNSSGSEIASVDAFGGFYIPTGLQLGTSALMYWASSSVVNAPSNGVIRLTNYAQTDFNRLQFGGTTSSFPALKRSSAILQARLADDSAYASFDASAVLVQGLNALTKNGNLLELGASYSSGVSIPTAPPASAAATGTQGTITWDADYIYICTATNTWKRVAIATWP